MEDPGDPTGKYFMQTTAIMHLHRTYVHRGPNRGARATTYLRDKGMSDAEMLTLRMDNVERERFVAEIRRLADEGEFFPLASD